jgi:hypothetical protein
MHVITEDPKVRGVSVTDKAGRHHTRFAEGWFCSEDGRLVQWGDLLPQGPLLTNWAPAN